MPAIPRNPFAPILLLALPIVFAGCFPKNDAPKPSNEEKYQVEDEPTKKTKTESETISSPTANDTSKEDLKKNSPTKAPDLPSISAGKDDRSFLTLRAPSGKDAISLMTFLAQADRAFQELLANFQAGQVTQQMLAEHGSRIARLKLDASELLIENGESASHKDAAICAKIESLSQLAGFQDVEAARKLEAFAEEAKSISNPKAAHQAKLVLFSFRLSEYETGQMGSSVPLLQEMDTLLSEKEILSLPDLRMMGQTLISLQRQGDQPAYTVAKEKITQAFKDHPDLRLNIEFWNLAVFGSESVNKMMQALAPMKTGTSGGSAELIREATKEMIEAFPWAVTLVVVAKNAIDIEFAGFPENAKVIIDEVVSHRALADSRPELKSDIDRTISDFQIRHQLVGKKLELQNLAMLDGTTFDSKLLEGKVTLVQFWAADSPPSVQAMQSLVDIYKEYQPKGFEIVGINLDANPDAAKQFLTSTPLPWLLTQSADPQARGFDTPMAKQCGVTAIPLNILLDRQGVAVALYLRDAKLRTQLDELLRSSP